MTRKHLNDKSSRKKVHAKAFHSLSIMETTLATRTKDITKLPAPKGQLGERERPCTV